MFLLAIFVTKLINDNLPDMRLSNIISESKILWRLGSYGIMPIIFYFIWHLHNKKVLNLKQNTALFLSISIGVLLILKNFKPVGVAKPAFLLNAGNHSKPFNSF